MVRSTEPHVLITEPAAPVSEPPARRRRHRHRRPRATNPSPKRSRPSAVSVAADPSAMVIVDDAGVMVPNQSGWEVFDNVISQRLIPADVSASVAVLVDGELVHQAAFGVRVAGSGEPTEVTDRFRIASISKTITAIVIMQMVERGELSLDQPVGQILLDHLGVAPSDLDAPGVTVRQLLSHTSGFPKYQSVFFSNGAVSYADAARIGMSGPVAPAPGAYIYSNMNFAVLSVLIEAVTGQAYERVVADRLLAPLGFTDMRMTGTFDLGPDEVSHNPRAGRNYMEVLGGAGSWNATPTEVATIYNSIDPATGGAKALSPESMALDAPGRADHPTGIDVRAGDLQLSRRRVGAHGHDRACPFDGARPARRRDVGDLRIGRDAVEHRLIAQHHARRARCRVRELIRSGGLVDQVRPRAVGADGEHLGAAAGERRSHRRADDLPRRRDERDLADDHGREVGRSHLPPIAISRSR